MNDALKCEYIDTTLGYRLRTDKAYRKFRKFLLNNIIPPVATFTVLFLTLAILSHLAFNLFDAAGFYCHASPASDQIHLEPDKEKVIEFRIDSLCQPTRVMVKEGQLYDVTIRQPILWRDGSQEASLRGFSPSDVGRYLALKYIVATPFRRTLVRRWLRIILRVGSVGAYEEFFDPDDPSAKEATERLRFKRAGELFLYVNDVVLPAPTPRLAGVLYGNNSGTAEVRVKRIGAPR